MLPEVEYLDHAYQLKSFLGQLNCYNKFLPSLPTNLTPLYKLLQAKVPWMWGTSQQRAFETAKAALTSDHLLIRYDPDKQTTTSGL